jgi:sugar phosphate permease
VLAAGTAAQASFAAIGVGLPAIAPAIRERFDLSLSQLGLVFAAEWLGTLLTLLPWGLLTDRVGERLVLGAGLSACGVLLAVAGRTTEFATLFVLLFLAGAFGASVNAASGRAVMGWFDASERGFALGIRQAAVPIGGLVGAVLLPQLSVPHAFAFLGGLCLLFALVGAVLIREPAGRPVELRDVEHSLRDTRLWRLCGVSGLYLVSQIAVMSFVVVYLHDERGLGKGEAAAVLAGVQLAAGILRVSAGRWSDVLGSRIVPLERVGLAMTATLAFATVLLDGPLALLIPAFVVAGALSMAWNGLAFAATAELFGRARSGAAIGVQQSTLSAVGVVVPIAFAAVAAGSWRAAYGLAAVFPLLGWWALRPLRRVTA